MKECASKSTLKRLPFYLSVLKNKLDEGETYISSSIIAKETTLNDVQVRKDLATASKEGGKPKIGYEIKTLINDIENYIGCYETDHAILVGVGSLGRAFLGYSGFAYYGLKIVDAFDNSPDLINKKVKGFIVKSTDEIQESIKNNKVAIGIITVPTESAQSVCDELVKGGVKAIWNFASTRLIVPDGILVQNENMASSLAVLSRHLHQKTK